MSDPEKCKDTGIVTDRVFPLNSVRHIILLPQRTFLEIDAVELCHVTVEITMIRVFLQIPVEFSAFIPFP